MLRPDCTAYPHSGKSELPPLKVGSLQQHIAVSVVREAVVADDFPAAFTVTQMIKDFKLISDTARDHGVPLLTARLILELYRAAANAGLRDEDFFALVKWHADLSPT